MPAVTCEWDGYRLTLTPEGLEPSCPVCETDLQTHASKCVVCGPALNLPDNIDLEALLTAMGD